MNRKAVVHIGVPKTGSTTLQSTLAASRAALQENGFHYSEVAGRANHVSLAHYVLHLAKAPAAEVKPPSWTRGSTMSDPHEFEQRLAAEIGALPASVHTLVFSCEHLSNERLAGGLPGLKALLGRFCDAVEVVAYLRRQDQQTVSKYTTLIKGRRTAGDPLDAGAEGLDYARLLHRCGEAFGFPALRPRIFDRADLHGGDVVADFLHLIGCPRFEADSSTGERNVGLRPAAQELLRLLNLDRQLAEPEMVQLRRSIMQGFVNKTFAGATRMPARAAAMEYYAGFQASNEAVRSRWFPERGTLFNEDFSRYPEVATPAPSDGETLGVAIAVIGHLLKRIAKQPVTEVPGRSREAGAEPKAKQMRQRRGAGAGRAGPKPGRAERQQRNAAKQGRPKPA